MGRSLWAAAPLACALALTASTTRAQEIGGRRRVGLGAVVGFPDNGVSFNLFFNERLSLQADAGLHVGSTWLGVGLRADVLFWMPKIKDLGWSDLVWYFGPGARVDLRTSGGNASQRNSFGLGAEFLFGIGFQWHRAPIELLVDGGPVLNLIDPAGYAQVFTGTVGLRFRYYF